MSAVSWPDALVGFALGLLPAAIRQAYILVSFLRRPERSKYLGEFWAYHRTTRGTGEIRESRIDISFSLLRGKLLVKYKGGLTAGSAVNRLVYSGSLSGRQGSVRYFSFKAQSSHEWQTWAMIDPFYSPFEMTLGTYVALDTRGLPVAGANLLSRNRIPIVEVERLLVNTVIKTEPLE